MNGAESLVETLAAGGVEVCFANPGTSEMHFVAALDRTRRMRCVLGLFEGVVSGAADGYGRMAGKPACTLLHLAAGFGNAAANLHNARKARTPLLNIVGDHATFHAALDAPLAADVEGAARPFSHWVRTSPSAAQVAVDGAAALAAARSWPGGVATLILPADTAWNEAPGTAAIPEPQAPQPVDDATIQAAARLLQLSEPRLILIGGAVPADARALSLAAAIARLTGAELMAPTANRRIERGRGHPFLERVPYPVDMALERLGRFRHVLLVEAKEPVAFFAYPGKPSRVLSADCALHWLARPEQSGADALERLAERLGIGKTVPPGAADRPVGEAPSAGPVTAELLARAVTACLPENAIVVDEGITAGREIYPLTAGAAPHSWLSITGGSIGIGMPLATGAAVACPERKVLSLQADGSGMYTLQALWTQAREGLDITTVVFSNRGYESLKGELFKVGANPGRTALDMLEIKEPQLDWTSLARGMGVEGERVEDVAALLRALQGGFRSEGPYLIEAIVD
jgi:acetolactate synthase I/II/III large subunit